MNIQEYIASGAIEAYVLGIASAKEKAEFVKLCAKSPELRAARLDFELALEKRAFANAVAPSPELKETVLELIRQESAVNAAKKIIDGPKTNAVVRKLPTMRWAFAASIALLIATSSFVFFLYTKNNALIDRIAKSKETLDEIDAKNREAERQSIPENYSIKQVNATLPKQTIPVSMQVYWDSTNTNVYLVVKNLEKLPGGQKYEISIGNKGKYKSLGLFDAPVTGEKLILKVNNAQASDEFAIGIVKELPNAEGPDTINLPAQK